MTLLRVWNSTEAEDGKSEAGNLKRVLGGKMATGPVVSMQSGSPARELSVSVQHGGNQTHGDRIKPEDATGKSGL